MTRDILSIIQTRMNTFSKGQKLIARFILESYDKAAFMTASRLGKTVNVSESTVVRFAACLLYTSSRSTAGSTWWICLAMAMPRYPKRKKGGGAA